MADDFDRYTERARHVLTLAQEEALRLNHSYIGTEHLLLALIGQDGGSALAPLRALGVDVDKLSPAVRSKISRGYRSVYGEVPLTPGAKRVIHFAADEARRLGVDRIGCDHLLLGLVREGEGIAARALEEQAVDLEELREEVTRGGGEEDPREPATVIDGRAIADEVHKEVAARARALNRRGVTPGLALILVGDNPSSLSYVRSKGDAAEQAGIFSETFHLTEAVSERELISRIIDIEEDPRFHAVLVQLPLPEHLNESAVIHAIEPTKDVDGVTSVNQGRLLQGEPCPWPATPAGVVELLHRSGNPPAGKHVVVCGRSNIVGKPIAAILMQKNPRANATVTVCHTGTPDLRHFSRQADILIAAMGVPRAITAGMVKPGAVVIDIGNNWIPDDTRKSGRRLVGDVDFEGVLAVAGAITPVPGGVGPMTVAMLLSNTVLLAEQSLA
ncbi:MAG: tetrahydrofolate dehydrogenase/cyclohydrolase catalytic domain-containing protein [Dehalococcoidia bacterium]